MDSREVFAPYFDVEVIPPWMFVPSPHNITIECRWCVLMETWGVNILHFYNLGRHDGFYHPNDELHQWITSVIWVGCNILTLDACRQISNWIWFPLVQCELDTFVDRQNAHHIRKQSDMALPSGGWPDQFHANPEMYGSEQCLTPVDMDEIDELLADSEDGLSHMQYIDKEFGLLAEEAYEAIGGPEITLDTAWAIFRQMLEQMSADAEMGSS